MTALEVVFAALLGAAVGSFLNVVIHRVPRGESLVRPASRCPGCGNEIANRDNIPVVSWLLLRGRCRNCGQPISARYPLIEAATAGLWIASVLRFDGLEASVFVALGSTALLALAAIDLEHRRLPNIIVLPSTVAAILWVGGLAVARSDLGLFVTAISCGAASFVLFFVIALISGGMGMGDVKLAAFIGVLAGRFGWEVAVAAVFLSFFAGGLAAITLLLARKAGRKQAIPFGPAMSVGAVASIFAGPGPVRAWLGL